MDVASVGDFRTGLLRACNGSGDVDTVLRITDVADLPQMSDLVVDADTLDPATSFGG